MINIRSRKIPVEVQENFIHDLVEVSADAQNIPLKDVNWAEQYCCLRKDMANGVEKVRKFPVRKDDVFLVSLPKCGSTWMQEATWLLMNDLNFEVALQKPTDERCPFLEKNVKRNAIEEVTQMHSPRLIKTHLRANLIPQEIWNKKTKIIYVARNPKDTIVSYFHFVRGLGTWKGSIEIFVNAVLESNFAFLPFWKHVLDFWYMRNEPNIFFTTYESMTMDLRSVLNDLCKFLEKPKLTEDQMWKLIDHLSFEKMKANPKANPTDILKANHPKMLSNFQFIRRGTVKCYKDELPEHCIEAIDEWTQRKLKPYKISAEEIFGKF